MNFSLLLSILLTTLVEGRLFGGKTGVHELSARNFKDEVLYNGNVSAVVFYAPWCGYCQKLVPEYKEAAKRLRGLAHVAAVNCDADVNKALCAKYQINGFPTIKVFQPAKLTDVDFKNVAAEKGPVPKRRPTMYAYDGPREGKALTEYVVSHLRNYVATLESDDSLKWLAPNRIPRVLFLPGKKYKARHISPLFKVLSREYFGKMRFAMIPRRIDGAWNLLGMTAQDESQLIYMSDDKTPVVYKGSMKKAAIKRFLEEQYELEQHRHRQKKWEVEREDAANGLEFVVEDQQKGELEHVKSANAERKAQLKLARDAKIEAFARLGKKIPQELLDEEEEEEKKETEEFSGATPTEEDAVEAEDFEYTGGSATEEEEADAVEEEAVDADAEDKAEEISLDAAVVELSPDQIVEEGPEAVASYLAQQRSAQEEAAAAAAATETADPSKTEAEGAAHPKPTPKAAKAGIYDYDMFVKRCIRTGYHCAVMVTNNATREEDLIVLIRSLERIPPSMKKATVFDFTPIEEADDTLKEFYSEIGLNSRPGLVWFDSRRHRYALYEQGWNSLELPKFLQSYYERKQIPTLALPPKYYYWVTTDEVDAYDKKAKKERVKDEL